MRPVVPLLLGLLLAGCGSQQAAAPGPTDPEPITTPGPATSAASGLDLPPERAAEDYPMADPPRFHVLTDHGQVDLRPWTICGPGYCADGGPDDHHLPDVGALDHLDFGFDLSGWQFRGVTFRELGTDCPRTISVSARKTGEREFRIEPAGPAGRWAVDIFGRGPGGDAVTTVEWTTTSAGSDGPAAAGVAAVLADHDGRLDSYGVELSLRHLARRYDHAAASLAVTSADGRSVTVPLRGPGACYYAAGDLFFRASEDLGRRATTLGPGPFTYAAQVRLGGETFTGTGTWPDDVIRGNEPNVKLTWDPPLPGYASR